MNPITQENLVASQRASLEENKRRQAEREASYQSIRHVLRFYFKQHIYQHTDIYILSPVRAIHDALQKQMNQNPTAGHWSVPMFFNAPSFKMATIREELGRTIHFKDLTDIDFIRRAFTEAIQETIAEWLTTNFPAAKLEIADYPGERSGIHLAFEMAA